MASPDARSSPAAPGLVNLPNGLTVLRLVLVPVFVTFLVTDGAGARIVAFFVFGVASATDFLDGQLARRSGMITDFGKIADPIADKALTGSALITLSVLGDLPWWVTAVILIREVAVTLLRFWVIRHGVIAASRGGKFKTVLQIIAIGLYILPLQMDTAREAVMAAAVAVTLVTGVDYVARALNLRRAARASHAGTVTRGGAGPAAAGPAAAGLAGPAGRGLVGPARPGLAGPAGPAPADPGAPAAGPATTGPARSSTGETGGSE